MIGCMICGITFYPGTCDPEDIMVNRLCGKKEFSIVEMFNVKVNIQHLRKRLWKEHHVQLDITEQDLEDLKKVS